MATKLISILALALLLGACESTSPDTTKPTATPTAQPTISQAPNPSPETSPAASLKAGDKVKVTVNGAAVDATIVSVDEKTGKATVKVQGEAKERTINVSEIVK